MSHVQCAMDDGGQRLLDVIEDTHVLETFLRENFSNSGLEDSPRFDNVSSSTDSSLVSSGGLDSFVFDGQLVDPLRGGPSHHSSLHPHQVNPHVLQQVLHSPSLSSNPSFHPHQLHPHQHHHLQQSALLQQHQQHQQQQHQQQLQQQQQHHLHHQSVLPALHSPIGSNLDIDCIGRNRESCGGTRNDSDHTLQQLLASAPPLGSSQPLLQLHHQSHQPSPHQTHPLLHQPVPQTHQIHSSQSPHSLHQPSSVLPPQNHTPQISSQNVLLHHHQPQTQRQPPTRQQQQPSSKSHQQHQQQTHVPPTPTQNSDMPNSILPLGVPTSASIGGTCSRLSNLQLPPSQLHNVTSQEISTIGPPSKTHLPTSTISNSPTKATVAAISTQSIIQAGANNMTNKVQVVGGHSRVISSGPQLLTSSQILPGAQMVQPTGTTQMISGGSILTSGQMLSAPNVLPGGQVITGMQGGQVFQGGQLIQGAQVFTNSLLNNSHVITSVGGIGSTGTSLYVTPSLASQLQNHSGFSTQLQNKIISSSPNTSTSISISTSGSLMLHTTSAGVTTTSTFTIPTKSPASSLPRASPGPSYPATPSPHHTATSPASFPCRSPAPSPHTHVTTMRSPATPVSPAITPSSQPVTSVVNSLSNHSGQLMSGVVGNVMQGLVNHPFGGSNGVVITQGGNAVQVAGGIKQVMQGGQLIQLVSSPQANQHRHAVALPKPIQPKPQLLPKPSPQGTIRQPTTPPPGKSLISTRQVPQNTQHQIVLGSATGQQPTVISQQNLQSLLLNSSFLQAGLQQPLLIPQPNGVQLLVRPAGHNPSGNAGGQTLIMPMPGQSHVVTSMGKVPQPQTLVIPANGQTPALVIPQGLGSTLGSGSVLSSTQGGRAHQPILRLVAPQAQLQLQQINTPNGPMLVAVPIGQALNIPGVFASNTVRTLAPQVAQGTLQLTASSLAPASGVNINHIQIPGNNLSGNSTSHPIHLTTSLPSTLSSVISTTNATKTQEVPSSTTSSARVMFSSSQAQNVDANKNNKKKAKKKKKEKESKDDRNKGKAVSINLNELLKESGIVSEMIFDENDFGGLGFEETQSSVPAATQVLTCVSSPVATSPVKVTPVNSQTYTSCGTQLSLPVSTISYTQNQIAIPSMVSSVNNSISSLPTSMCFTLDAQGKLILGSVDAAKPQISLPQVVHSSPLQGLCSSGFNLSSGGSFVFESTDGTVHGLTSPKNNQSSLGHIVALHPHNNDTNIIPPTLMKIDNVHQSQFQTSSKSLQSKIHVGNEMIKVAQNTQLLYSQTEKSNGTSIISSLLNNPVPPLMGITNSNTDSNSMSLHFNDKINMQNIAGDFKPNTSFTLSSQTLASSQPSQISINNPTVIVSSNLNNSFLPGAIFNGKSNVPTSQNSDLNFTSNSIPQQVLTNSLCMNQPKITKASTPVSTPVIDSTNKVNSYQNQYIASVKNHNIIENKINKRPSRRKKKKDQDVQCSPVVSTASQTLRERIKSSTASRQVQINPVVIHNGNVTTNSTGTSFLPNKCEVKTEAPIIVSPGHSNSMPMVMVSPNHCLSDSTTGVTSFNSYSIPPTITSVATSKSTNMSFTSSSQTSQNNSPGGFVFTGQQVVLQSGQQLKQLLLSPQNQEALKRLHSQIQDLQNRKATSGEQDKLLHQKLIAEYKRIMATGTPVPVCSNSLPQVQQNINSTNQHNAIKYSHSVGHKKIFLTPNQKKTPSQHVKKSFVEPNDTTGMKLKEVETIVLREVSCSTSIASSCHTVTGFAATTATVTMSSPTLVSSVTSHHQHISPGRTIQAIKAAEPEISCPSINVSTSLSSESFQSISDSPNSSQNIMSMPLLIPSPKAAQVSLSVSPSQQCVSTPQKSPVASGTSISTQNMLCSTPLPLQLPSTSIQPQQPSQNTSHQMHSTHSPNNNSAVQQTGFTIPLTREQLFELQLRTDQNGALAPDYNTPFKNKTDACKRLIRYHVFNDIGPSPKEMTESDMQFEVQSETLIRKFNSMKQKYQTLLLKDSMRRHPSSETAMMYRLFVNEEKQNIESDKQDYLNGKDLNLPPAPPHWLTGQDPPPYYPFSWEDNWLDEKVYVLNSCPASPQSFSKDEDYPHIPFPRGEEGETLENRWEEDLDEEGPDEPRLQILEGEETDESLSRSDHPLDNSRPNSASDVETVLTMKRSHLSREYSSCDSDSAGVSRSSINDSKYSDNDHLDERTTKRTLSESSTTARLKNNKCESDNSLKYSNKNDRRSNENLSCNINHSTKENGIDRIANFKSKPFNSYSSAPYERNDCSDNTESRESLSDQNSYSEKDMQHYVKYNKYEKKFRADKEKRRHERSRDKGRSKDERRLWKMKLKHEEKPFIPPLLIRSDERSGGGGGGGLKLTLKKQVGSGDYYRVGREDPEYRVAPTDKIEERSNDLDEDNDASAESNRQMRNLSVVLEDCLHRNKRESEENKSVSKKNKRLKAHHNDLQLCNEFDIRLDRKTASAGWSSPYTDNWVRQEKHNSIHRSSYVIQSQQYLLDSSDIPTSQALCVPSPGPKIIHQPPRSSHRLS